MNSFTSNHISVAVLCFSSKMSRVVLAATSVQSTNCPTIFAVKLIKQLTSSMRPLWLLIFLPCFLSLFSVCWSVSLQQGGGGGGGKKLSCCLVLPDGNIHTHTQRAGVSASVSGFSEQRHDVCVTCLFCKAEINLGQCANVCYVCVYLRERESPRLTKGE